MALGRISVIIALAAACGKSAPEHGAPSPPPVGAPVPQPIAAPAAGDRGALGALHFAIAGGTPEARGAFDRGLLALHSFWYDEATRQFQAAITADPSFAMAYWGLAMSHAKLLWGDDDLEAGRDALKRMPNPSALPPHDQAWVVAALALFKRASLDVRASRADFVAVMEQVHAKFPDDESALFLALALLSTIRPGDADELAVRKRAAALAQAVFERNPKHPGAAHYVIHADDTPALAALALPAAQQYAAIAPAAFHALHMPAHIFVRLGRWKDAAASCQAAWDASVAWVTRDQRPAALEDFHSLSWLVELGFERGRRGDAERALATYAAAVRAGLPHDKRAAFANQVGSFVARTGEAARVDELLGPLAAPASDASPAADCGHPAAGSGAPTALFERRAVLATRAQAAAMQHDAALVAHLLDQRDAVDAELHPFLVATQPKDFVASADKLRGQVRSALLARARGDDRALIAALQPLAIDQDQDFTGEGLAGGVLHHEDIAEALLRIGQPAKALAEYGVVLASHPGRARALLGAARAAAQAGDLATSRERYRSLLASWRDAEDNTDGLAEARRAVAP